MIEQHTPGPWKAVKGFGPLDSPDTDPERWNVVAAGNNHEYLIATIENGQPGDCVATEGRTALLIAAAPDLKSALEFIRNNSGDPVMEAAANSALTKAEGR